MPAETVDELATQLLDAAGVDSKPPIDLEHLAAALGVNSIERLPMVEDGRLERHASVCSIYVRAGVNPARQRFTIAHELGHLVLAGPHREFVAHRMWPGADHEERFCDRFAAAILLPRRWVVEEFSSAPERLFTARRLAQASRASLSASTVRLRQVLGWRSSMLHWRRHDAGWRLASTAGVPREMHNRITSTSATRETLEALAGLRGDQRTRLPIAIGGVAHEVSGEISVRGRSAVALATLHD